MSVTSHPVERVTVSGFHAVPREHGAGHLSAVRGIRQHVRDDAVELKRFRWITQRVDDRVTADGRLGDTIIDALCDPPGTEVFVMDGQLRRRRRILLRVLPTREVAALDGGQPDLLRPYRGAEHRADARLRAIPVEDDLARRDGL